MGFGDWLHGDVLCARCLAFAACHVDKFRLSVRGFPCLGYLFGLWARQIDIDHLAVLFTPILEELFDCLPRRDANLALLSRPFLPTRLRTERKSNALVPDIQIPPIIVFKTLPTHFPPILSIKHGKREIVRLPDEFIGFDVLGGKYCAACVERIPDFEECGGRGSDGEGIFIIADRRGGGDGGWSRAAGS